MCIAIYLPAKKEIKKDVLETCNEANPHGFGYAYFDNNNKLRIHKTVKNVTRQIKDFLKIRKTNIDKPFILHFRIATHGRIIPKCCHPFRVNDNLVFCHNGILGSAYTGGLDMHKSEISDSIRFGSEMLAKLPPDFMNNEKIKELLADYIGPGNKMILLNKNGTHWILNENKGIWENGIWFSNGSYKKVKYFNYSDWDKNNNLFTYGGGYTHYGQWHNAERKKDFATPKDNKLIKKIIENDKPNNIIGRNNKYRAYKSDYDPQHLHVDGITKNGATRYYDTLTGKYLYFCEFCEVELCTLQEINSQTCVFCKNEMCRQSTQQQIDFENEDK